MFKIHADEADHALLIVHDEDATAVKLFGHRLFPHKTDQVFFLFAFQYFNQGQFVNWPDHFDHIVLEIMDILSITHTWVADHNDGIGGFRQFVDLAHDG